MADTKVSALDAADDIDPEDLFLVIKPASPNNLMTHATGEQLRDFCGGSFLSSNTARVDASGDDITGTVGDLAKPFLTVQGAIDAIEALDLILHFNDTGVVALIDVGPNAFSENLTTSMQYLGFVGTSYNTSRAFNSLHFTSTTGVYARFMFCGGPTITSDATTYGLTLDLENAQFGSITSAGPLQIACDLGPGQVADITAAGNVTLYGLNDLENISAPGFEIHIQNCQPIYASPTGAYSSMPTIDSAGSEIWATGSVIQSVTAAGTLHLIDSRVVGTNNATSTVYADVLFAEATTSVRGIMSAADKTKLNAITGTNTGDQTSVTGNAGTATALQTARTINGVSFNGTANITIAAGITVSQVLALKFAMP